MAITSLSQLDENQTYTYGDYLLWQLKESVELIRGKVFRMSPAPNLVHQRIAGELTAQFVTFFRGKRCQVFPAPFDVRLPTPTGKSDPSTVVQPDLCVVCDLQKLDQQGCNGAPDLIIEILSPGNSNKEMREKFEVYEESGVREYWLVNPTEKAVFVYLLNDEGAFIGLQPLTEEQTAIPHLFPDLHIDLKEVFRAIPGFREGTS